MLGLNSCSNLDIRFCNRKHFFFFLYVFNLSIRAYMLYSINSLVFVSVFVGQRFDDAVFLYDSISLLWLKRFKNEGGVLFFIGYGCN